MGIERMILIYMESHPGEERQDAINALKDMGMIYFNDGMWLNTKRYDDIVLIERIRRYG